MYAYGVTTSDLAHIASQIEGITVDADLQSDRNRIRFTLKLDRNSDKVGEYRKWNPHPEGLIWSNKVVPNGATVSVAEASGWKWRKGQSVCYHGHYVFLEKLFARCPDARVVSNLYGKIEYTADTFAEKANALGDQRLGKEGNIYHAFRIRDTCQCEHMLP